MKPTDKFEEALFEHLDEIYDDLSLFTQHSDLYIPKPKLDLEGDFHMKIVPRQQCNWGLTAYKFGNQPDMKIDRWGKDYRLDGQPRVVVTGNGYFNYVRYVSEYDKHTDVTFEIMARQPSHYMAERELAKYYGIWKHLHGMQPIDVLRRFIVYGD